MPIAILAGLAAGMFCGVINGLIVTVLKVNPIIATLGTLAAFDGLAFLIAPEGKPVGVVTQPDFTWLGTGRFLEDLPIPDLGGRPWPGIPIVFVILIVVAVVMHIVMRYTDFGRSIYAIGGNATAARLAGINLRNVRIAMYIISGAIAGPRRRAPHGPDDVRQPDQRPEPRAPGHHGRLPRRRGDGRWPRHDRRDVPRGAPRRRAVRTG